MTQPKRRRIPATTVRPIMATIQLRDGSGFKMATLGLPTAMRIIHAAKIGNQTLKACSNRSFIRFIKIKILYNAERLNVPSIDIEKCALMTATKEPIFLETATQLQHPVGTPFTSRMEADGQTCTMLVVRLMELETSELY